ncbi:porin family protein [Amphritea pacifica]|uniref:Porin family protein n=1 Tax=Amphritea pacifica TaxID=2811233 RepID=A0ABS2WEC7_9GAMM|nr:outer membrane beta-barrel protein [Amphritea pacifica]MBN0989862.1 porin family protein [Amphritea pacifica]MBN1009156.1 porin family protein [Amphritea pacifica]
MKKSLLAASVAAAISLASVNAFAADDGLYVGASIGKTSSSALDDLDSIPGVSVDDSDTGYKLFAGYNFTSNIALEGFYTDLGQISATDGINKVVASMSSVGVAAVGTLPVNDSFGVFAKVGYQAWNARVKETGMSLVRGDGTDVVYGIGASYNLDVVSIRGELERYDLDGDGVNLLSLGVAFNF